MILSSMMKKGMRTINIDQGDDLGPGTLDDLDDLDLVSYPTR